MWDLPAIFKSLIFLTKNTKLGKGFWAQHKGYIYRNYNILMGCIVSHPNLPLLQLNIYVVNSNLTQILKCMNFACL